MIKKIVVLLFSVSFLFSSCIPVMDSRSKMYITNNTKDTIVIGYSGYHAKYNIIDSVSCFLFVNHKDSHEYTKFNGKEELKIGSDNLILPDSSGIYDATTTSYGPRLGGDNGKKGYFFIIKLETINKYTWNDICKMHMYDMLVVNYEMLKMDNVIKYKNTK